ncbi:MULTISPECIES: L-2-hydroxyglutarate oxidase [Thermomonospora]|uniref:L-2-hydroxyglutarate oxidase LhgO n=1 Tax=Thermomonospora cellulosilytica TaxID=1411118 RepID=A0A7W3RC20_9ACTN|nr:MULTISPECIES: L-2-hydroxyglutarate oxidase [Thermomonospora]MBA9007501.1 L-2-hydroxyglutarate oxidase LhgO [Thermomonospora cellulosilytica]
MTSIGVVGGGIIGLATARRLAASGTRVTVLEKEDRLAAHQTGHNSGVAHAGLYYAPGSLKATLCRRGIGLLKEYCAERGLPYVECGKVVVARHAGEVSRLREIRRRATANGVPGLRWLDAAGLREVEPHAAGVAALHSPHTAIVDFPAVARAFAEDVTEAGGTVRLGFEVTRIRRSGGRVVVNEELAFDRLVVCAGLQSDRVARLAGDDPAPAIVPFRGEYYRLAPHRTDLVRGLIYPVPDPRYPFLGVHFTRRVDGGVDVGPNAVLALAREGYRRRDLHPADVWETLRWPGFRRLARRHWRTGLREMYGSAVKRAFAAEARSFVPELRVADLVPAPAGVRAQAVDPDGSLVDDFRIGRLGPVVTVRNAPSPAATSSLAIAEHVAAQVLAD